ncbi:hypothetical protein BY458DRAFT_588500 [Sporodiniella umbellata]|nr:hypothetical protein BY458DRAFT_588500 [Sporodiniella umbellata]
MSATGSTSSHGTHSRSPSRSRSPPPYSDGRYSSRYRYDYNYRSGRSMSAALDDYRDLRDRERDRERMLRDDRYMPPRRDRYAPYYRDDLHYPPPPPPHSYSKIPPGPLRRDEPKDKIPLGGSSTSKDLKDDKPNPPAPPEPYGRYVDWRERRYRDEERRRDYDRRYMRYDTPGYGPPPFSGDSYRNDRDLPPSPGIPYYERDRLDDRDYYRRPPPSDYDRYRPGNGGGSGSGRGGPGRPGWRPQADDRRMMDREREREKPYNNSNNFNRNNNDSTKPAALPQQPLQIQKQPSSLTQKQEQPMLPTPTQRPQEESSKASKQPELTQESTQDSPQEKPRAPQQETARVRPKASPQEPSGPTPPPVFNPPQMVPKPIESPQKQEAPVPKEQVPEKQSPKKEPERQLLEKQPLPSRPHEPESNRQELPKRPEEPSPTSKTQEDPIQLQSQPKPIQAQARIPLRLEAPKQQVSLPEQEKPKAPSPPQNVKPKVEETPMEIDNIPDQVDSLADNKKEEQTPLEIKQEKVEVPPEMTQEQIVERIDHIENEISRYEEMLEAATRREEENKAHGEEDNEDEEDNEEQRKAQHEEAKKQALQAMDEDTTSTTKLSQLADSPVMRKRPQLLINQLRGTDEMDELLCEQILEDNKKIAKENSKMMGGWQDKDEDMDEHWSDEEKWSKPLYKRIEDYDCYKANVKGFERLRVKMANTLRAQDNGLKKKEKALKNEFKSLYEQWKEKNLALDRIREHERKGSEKYHRGSNRRRDESGSEEYIDHVIFVAGASDALRFKNNGASTPYTSNGLYTSDAARSEAELLEIIQSLETAEMRNPESRAKKTTATIPPMIMDIRERMRTFDDRSGLIEDPLTYYHTGPDTGDIWNQQEVTTFMESYMMYPKQFERISRAVGTKTAPQCVLFYYRKKKKIDFKALMKKGRRGKTNKHRDRIAAAIRAVTGESGSTTRKAKSKGSALMADIGEAQNSRKAKEKDAERKSRELRDIEQTYWGTERKRAKRPSASTSGVVSEDNDTVFQESKRRAQASPQPTALSLSGPQPPRRKGRSPRESMQLADLIYPSDTSKRTMEGSGEEEDEKVYSGGSTKWTDREKETVIEAFKQHGRNFSRVSALLPSKTEEQVRNFYHNFKRKNGPNVFDEESNPRESQSTNETNFSGRIDLKAEEEDAAAALVGMFQMGSNREDTARSRAPGAYDDTTLRTSTPPPQLPPGGGIAGAQRRRRIRTASGRTENTMDEDWVDSDYGNKPGSNRKLNRTTSLTDKRSSYSSYWSVSERNDFLKYLESYGRDWEKLSIAMKTKTVIQVRNFYTNNEDRMQLKEIVDRFHSSQRSSAVASPSHPQPSQAYPYPTNTTVAAPPPPPPTTQAYAMGPRTSYFPVPVNHRMNPPPPVVVAPPPYPNTVRPSHPREPETSSSSAVTKVADLLNNDDPTEANQNSWETWFGS